MHFSRIFLRLKSIHLWYNQRMDAQPPDDPLTTAPPRVRALVRLLLSDRRLQRHLCDLDHGSITFYFVASRLRQYRANAQVDIDLPLDNE
jgi:hypothetical protein